MSALPDDEGEVSLILRQFGLSSEGAHRFSSSNLADVYQVRGGYILRGRQDEPGALASFAEERALIQETQALLQSSDDAEVRRLQLPSLLPARDGSFIVAAFGRLWTVYREIGGEPFGHWYELDKSTAEGDHQVVRILGKVHNHTRGRVSSVRFRAHFLEQLLEPWLPVAMELLPHDSQKTLQRALELTGDFLRRVSLDGTCFVHGDYHHGNILGLPDLTVTGIIDLNWCRRGHPWEDLGFTVMMLLRDPRYSAELIDQSKLQALLESYGSRLTPWDVRVIMAVAAVYGALDLAMFSALPQSDRYSFWGEFQKQYLPSLCGYFETLLI